MPMSRGLHTLRLEEITSKYCIYVSLFYACRREDEKLSLSRILWMAILECFRPINLRSHCVQIFCFLWYEINLFQIKIHHVVKKSSRRIPIQMTHSRLMLRMICPSFYFSLNSDKYVHKKFQHPSGFDAKLRMSK